MLADFLFPGERVMFKSPSEVKYRNRKCDLYVTDQRLIAFHRKKEWLFAERFRDLSNIRYREVGSILSKEAVITIKTVEGYEMEFQGKPSNMRAVWQEIQKLDIAKKLGAPVGVQVKCKFCGASVQPGASVCPGCHKILK